MPEPDFLRLGVRPSRPRSSGLTHVIDGGIPASLLPGVLETAGHVVDIWKCGWGTAYLDPTLRAKVDTLLAHGIGVCPGGTLAEAAWLQGAVDDFFDWAADTGFTHVEISNGASGMPLAEKRQLISLAAGRFVVLSEVGSKDPGAFVHPEHWAEEARGDLRAGARLILAEGRESGTVGLYDPDGRVRVSVVEALTEALGPSSIVFEAPTKAQQAWFIHRLGKNVNLGNVAVEGILGAESLRLGLRADTIDRLGAATTSGCEATG